MGSGIRIFFIAFVALTLAVVGYFVFSHILADPLPDAVALERRLAESVAAGDRVATWTRALTGDGFECGVVADASGSWHCDLAERAPQDALDCPRRISVVLVPGEDGKLAGFSVTEGAFCL